MELDDLKREAYHSLLLYALVVDAPRLLHVPDAINAAIDGDMDHLKNDLKNMALDSLFDLHEYLLGKTKKSDEWKNSIRKQINDAKLIEEIKESKNKCIDILNEILAASTISNVPFLRKLI